MLNFYTILVTIILVHIIGFMAVSKYTAKIGAGLLVLGFIIGVLFSLLGVR